MSNDVVKHLSKLKLLLSVSQLTVPSIILHTFLYAAIAFALLTKANSMQWAVNVVGIAALTLFVLLLCVRLIPAEFTSRFLHLIVVSATLISVFAATLFVFGTRAVQAQVSNPHAFFLSAHDWLTTGAPLLLGALLALVLHFPTRPKNGRLAKLLLAARAEIDAAKTETAVATNANDSSAFSRNSNTVPHLPIVVLQDRANQLRTVNVFVLFLILGVLVSAAWIVIVAGRLVAEDTKPVDQIKDALARYDWAERRLIGHVQGIGELEARVKMHELSYRAISAQSEPKAGLTDATRQFHVANVALRESQSTLEGFKQELQQKRALLAKVEESVLLPATSAAGTSETTGILVAAAATRFGVLVLSIYLVQILVSLYRYNAQLSVQYSALSDALVLDPGSVEAMAMALPHVRPSVEFGVPPQAVTARIAAEVGKLLRRGDPESGKRSP